MSWRIVPSREPDPGFQNGSHTRSCGIAGRGRKRQGAFSCAPSGVRFVWSLRCKEAALKSIGNLFTVAVKLELVIRWLYVVQTKLNPSIGKEKWIIKIEKLQKVERFWVAWLTICFLFARNPQNKKKFDVLTGRKAESPFSSLNLFLLVRGSLPSCGRIFTFFIIIIFCQSVPSCIYFPFFLRSCLFI